MTSKANTVLRCQPGFQTRAYNSKAFLTILAGGAGSGKTEVSIYKMLEHIHKPDYCALVIRKEVQQIMCPGGIWNNILSKCAASRIRIKTNRHEKKITFPSGAIIQMMHSNRPMHELVEVIKGLEVNYVFIDEANSIDYEFFKTIPSRIRNSKCPVPPQIYITMNPTQDWTKLFANHFINENGLPDESKCNRLRYYHYINGEPVVLDSKQEFIDIHGISPEDADFIKTCMFIPSTIMDNKILLNSSPEYLGTLNSLDPAQKLALLYGSWLTIPSGGVFQKEDFKLYSELPSLDRTFVVCDTALKSGVSNDYSVFTLWGTSGSSMYLIDMVRGKWTYPALKQRLKGFLEMNPDCLVCYVEDIGSGTVLLDDLGSELKNVKFRAVDRVAKRKTKEMRAVEARSLLQNISVYLPCQNDSICKTFTREVSSFCLDSKHEHDDISDTFFDAIYILGQSIRRNVKTGNEEHFRFQQKIEQGSSFRSQHKRF